MLRNLGVKIIIVSVLIIGIASIVIKSPNQEEVDPLTYFSEFKTNQNNLVIEDQRVAIEKPIIEEDGVIYISHKVIKEYVDDRVYYDQKEGILSITNLQEVVRLYVGGNDTKVNGQYGKMAHNLIGKDDTAYIPEDFIEERYHFEIDKGTDQRLYMASNTEVSKKTAVVKAKKSSLRTHPDKKSLIVDKVFKGHQLIIYNTQDGYARVRDENGMIGYIAEKHIKVLEATEVKVPKIYIAKPLNNPLKESVKMVWDQMTATASGDWSSIKYTKMSGINVISPTWFEFKDSEGNLTDRGSALYVQQAHQRNIKVWALLSHNFSQTQLTKEILSSTNKRQHIINQLVEATQKYGLDGINIDIENVQKDFSEEWVQFMRELYPQLNQKGIAVSVDIYVPSEWSMHYERAKVAEVVDYFIVMAYDQYWSGSESAGPVAGLDWVETSVKANLEEVPKEKLVLGIPFYTRVWYENSEGLSSKAYDMQTIQGAIASWGVKPVFFEQLGQYYAEHIQGDMLKKVWIEDETSIRNRKDIIKKYQLAGYAAWKLGLETKDIWDVLNKEQ